ncbi:MAG: hypothetical protein ABI311_14985 [Gemmatimonadaceae bacterium]
MARINLTTLAVAGAIFAIALPVAAFASEPGPVPVHPTTVRSDTLTKLEKPKSERPAPSTNKKLKPSKATPSAPLRHEYLPDQPWETEFYVENDVSGRQAMQLALASFNPRR